MTDIISELDSYIASFFSSYTLKNWGFCELMNKTADGGVQPMPVTIPGRKQVAVLDTYEVVTWTRLVNAVNYELSEEHSFGKSEARVGTANLRLVFANKTSLNDSENLVFQFVEDLPSKFTVPGYEFVFIHWNPGVETDHEAIWLTELGQTVYEKHRFTWNLYAITINVQFLICEEV